MKKILLLSLMAGVLFAGGMRPSFSSIDTNSDGKISKAEFNSFKSKRSVMMKMAGRLMGKAPSFSMLDRNGDGFISKTEFSQFRRARKR